MFRVQGSGFVAGSYKKTTSMDRVSFSSVWISRAARLLASREAERTICRAVGLVQ